MHTCAPLSVGGCTCVFIKKKKKVPVILVCGSPQLTLSPVLYSSRMAPRERGKRERDGAENEQDYERNVKAEAEDEDLQSQGEEQ